MSILDKGVNFLRKIFITSIGFYLHFFSSSKRARDFIIWPLASRILGNSYNEITMLHNGLEMKTDLGDILGRFVIFYGPRVNYFWEPQTTKLMEILIKDAEAALVAGAHIGYLALLAKKAMVKEGSILYAFEPINYLYRLSRENFFLNKNLGNIVLYQQALSDTSQTVRMSVDSLRSAIQGDNEIEVPGEKVEAITIDNFIKQQKISRLDFMLLDVEGYEPQVFRGMAQTLVAGQPRDLIFEYSTKIKGGAGALAEYTSPLKPFNYNFYIIKDNYELNNIKKDWGQVEIFSLNNNWEKFNETSYVNMLATVRSRGELEKLGIHVSAIK